MLDIETAKNKVATVKGVASVVDAVRYNNLYVVRVTFVDPDESDWDPFYSVDVNTGAVKEYSLFGDGDIVEVTMLFLANED